MHSHWSYDMLKQLIIEGGNDAEIDELKEIFSSEIGTVRKKDRIHTIADLLDCLERHDEINEEKIEPLQVFGKRNPKVQEALNSYQKVEMHRPLVNVYRELRLAEELQQKMHIRPQPVRPVVPSQQNYVTVAQFTDEKRTAIYNRLSRELGRSWRDLGRKLRIPEGVMDDIETQFPNDLKSRILRLLQVFEEDECNDPRQLLLQLCQGLAGCGRNDLRRKVEQIMSH